MTDADYQAFEARKAVEERLEDENDRQHPELAIAAEDSEGPAIAGNALKLAVIVGHTRIASGAAASPPLNQSEYPWNTDLARMVRQECTQRGVECMIFFRDGIGISGAYQQVDRWQPTAAVELHFNAFNGTGNGTETLYGDIPGSREYAQSMQKALLRALELHDRGIQHRSIGERGGQSVNSARIPSVLIEPFFGDNAGDATRAKERKPALASAVVEGFAGAFSGPGV